MYRIDRFRDKGLSCCALFDDSKNIYYLTGYTGEGSLLVTSDQAVIITDFRYVEQCERQAPECTLEQTTRDRNKNAILKEYLDRASAKELFVETDVLTVDQYDALKEGLPGVELRKMPSTVQQMRMVKDETEIACLKDAARISCEAFEALLKQLKPGMTEKHACALLEHEMRVRGSEGIAFDTIVASGVNGSLPHAIPSDKPLREGELITFDFGARSGGYCADITRTIAMGPISQELKDIYDAVYTAHMNTLNKVKAGVNAKDLDQLARDYLEKLYPGAFGHSLGHGVGLYIHESPSVSFRSDTVLEPGHVITIEPGVYIKGLGGCRIEDTVIVTKDGFEDPFTVSKQLIVV
ncbi:MAG: aminopeptidase P family protein [Clostridia bacterium]|nr:aminopeptidase P family protein [Clostridia bacterium]